LIFFACFPTIAIKILVCWGNDSFSIIQCMVH
jgi:hypothetical protein